jgi:hypothetical protein
VDKHKVLVIVRKENFGDEKSIQIQRRYKLAKLTACISADGSELILLIIMSTETITEYIE